MNKYFSIPTEYIRKYTSNNTTSEEIRKFVYELINDWESEDECVYDHYKELESIGIYEHRVVFRDGSVATLHNVYSISSISEFQNIEMIMPSDQNE